MKAWYGMHIGPIQIQLILAMLFAGPVGKSPEISSLTKLDTRY